MTTLSLYTVKMISLLLAFLISFISAEEKFNSTRRYKPDWADLDSRPLPRWYDEAKIGIFLHWGVYSVPSFGSEWFWKNLRRGQENYKKFMKKAKYPSFFTYKEFAPMFTAELFDPDEWATLFQKAGAKYIVLTSKHHDGFNLFPSNSSPGWNSMEVGPQRDLVGELSKSVRDKKLKFGAYYSLFEWYQPIYAEDVANHYKTTFYPEIKTWPDITQLVNDYKISVLWADGDWEATDDYWKSKELLAWLYNDSPVKDEIVTNDRWGKGCYGKHGDFYNYADRYNPGKLLHHKWENAFTLDKESWGYRRNIHLDEIYAFDDVLYQVVSTVSCGGNALINVGPTKEGTITPIFQERLLSLGSWLDVNGEAIYKSSPWLHQKDTANGDVWYTCRKAEYHAANPTSKPLESDRITAIYAIMLKWPKHSELAIADVSSLLHSGNYQIQMLGSNNNLEWSLINGMVWIALPDKAKLKSTNAWTLKFKSTL